MKTKLIAIRSFSGTLPTGPVTRSVRRYVRAYRKLANPLLKLWPEDAKNGYKFEPGVAFGSIQFNSRQAITLYEALTGTKYTC